MSLVPEIEVIENHRVLAVKLKRPKQANAISLPMSDKLTSVFSDASRNDHIGAVLLSGDGPHFCAGGDFDLVNDNLLAAQKGFAAARAIQEPSHALIRSIETCRKPVITTVTGAAAGVGLAIALASDIVVAASDARFIYAYTKIGLPGDAAITRLLPARLGQARALQLALLDGELDAETARAWGLANYLTEGTAATYTRGLELAHKVADLPNELSSGLKYLMRTDLSVEDHKDREIRTFIECAKLGRTS